MGNPTKTIDEGMTIKLSNFTKQLLVSRLDVIRTTNWFEMR